jgi:hypothetical protein
MLTARHKKIAGVIVAIASAAVIALAVRPVRDAVCFARLSPTEKKVVGTWNWGTMDATEYVIVRPDHSYAFVSDFNSKELILSCSGHWRIEGDDIVIDCTTPTIAGFEKEYPPKTHSDRRPIDDFLKGLEPHAPVSYKSP